MTDVQDLVVYLGWAAALVAVELVAATLADPVPDGR
jgi:hypothetical protein